MTLRSRIERLTRQRGADRDPEFPAWTVGQADDFRAGEAFAAHVAARIRHRLGEGPPPGEMPPEAKAWADSQPARTQAEDARLLADMQRLVPDLP
jgi:hypothetical protein